MAKFGMSLITLGLSGELEGFVGANGEWLDGSFERRQYTKFLQLYGL